MPLPLAYYGDPILRKKTSQILEINDPIRQLIKEMIETMDESDGVGLAAPQVYQSLSLFVTRIPFQDENNKSVRGVARVFINPKILSYSEELWPLDEGCLSIPGFYRNVLRPAKIVIEATDLERSRFEEEFSHYPAHVFMHENDHLNGVLYVDRLPPKERKELEPLLKEIKKKYAKL